ncbi:major histocompatibility complex class I-related gene protein-like [Hemicordylus capensis]|uniref:major histocompatibility complex class I-related gene protein-like n=1 Tax=Hemicordylus capensis TaxID=884348 RepID=UPI00230202DD|nr:major histocompatibility complex class I-related gene protein-like [Hemicordylus capensis]
MGFVGVTRLLLGDAAMVARFYAQAPALQMEMEPLGWSLLLFLGTVAKMLGVSSGSSWHFLRHFYLGVSEPTQDLPWFTQLGFVDDQLITRYDSNTRRDQPQVPWVEKEEDPRFWERETHHAREAEQFFRQAFQILRSRYNQSGGLHTWQCLVGCELSNDRRQKGRFMQCGYDGRDFISLDKETFTWTAADDAAQVTKRKWETDPTIPGIWKGYLEKECIERLQKYLNYGKEILVRTESPVMKVIRKMGHDGLETLICRIDGFYPKEIDATWTKDGEVWEHETFRGGVVPNSDGTYHTWLSIEIDPKDRKRYRCHIEHDTLLEPLDLSLEEPVPVRMFVGVVAAILLVTGIILCTGIMLKKQQQEASRATQEATLSVGPTVGGREPFIPLT